MNPKRAQLWIARALAVLTLGALLAGELPTRSGSIRFDASPLFFMGVIAAHMALAWWLHRDAARSLGRP